MAQCALRLSVIQALRGDGDSSSPAGPWNVLRISPVCGICRLCFGRESCPLLWEGFTCPDSSSGHVCCLQMHWIASL